MCCVAVSLNIVFFIIVYCVVVSLYIVVLFCHILCCCFIINKKSNTIYNETGTQYILKQPQNIQWYCSTMYNETATECVMENQQNIKWKSNCTCNEKAVYFIVYGFTFLLYIVFQFHNILVCCSIICYVLLPFYNESATQYIMKPQHNV